MTGILERERRDEFNLEAHREEVRVKVEAEIGGMTLHVRAWHGLPTITRS